MNHETLLAGKILGIKMSTIIGGLGGGITIGSFYIPKKIVEKGIFIAGVMVAFSSLLVSGIFTQVLIDMYAIDTKYETAIAFTIGGFSLTILNWITNWLRKTDDMDITDAIDEIKDIKDHLHSKGDK